MRKYLSGFLAVSLALLACVPTFGAASTTVMSRVHFENQLRYNSKLFRDTMIDNGLFKYPFYMLANPSDPNIYGYYGKIVLLSTLGQNTTYTIPDPGAATANFLLSAGAQTVAGQQTFTAAPIFPTAGIILKGTSFNGTVKEVAGLGQATTYTIPDPGAATDTFATLGATNAFTGVNTFSAANGLGLVGTTYTGTVKVAAGLGQATAYTLPDPGASTGSIQVVNGTPYTLYHVNFPMSVTNVTAMYGTPVSVLTAVSGKTIVIEEAFMTYTEAGGAYASGGTVQLQYHGSNVATGVVAATQITAASGSTYSVFKPVTVVGNQNLGIDITNNTGAFTQSAATGAPVIDIYYRLQ